MRDLGLGQLLGLLLDVLLDLAAVRVAEVGGHDGGEGVELPARRAAPHGREQEVDGAAGGVVVSAWGRRFQTQCILLFSERGNYQLNEPRIRTNFNEITFVHD